MIRPLLAFATMLAWAATQPPPSDPPPQPAPAPTPGPFDATLLRIAAEYKQYPRVSDRANWAPAMCRAPGPTGVQHSRSPDAQTHGRKLYFLYAKDSAAYDRMSSYGTLDYPGTNKAEQAPWLNPVGQTVVKESFVPVEVAAAEIPKPPSDPSLMRQRELPDNYAKDGDKYFKAADPTQLFIMTRLDSETPGTDQGWVYGVVTADAKTVLSAGMIESCMDCHRKTTRDRLYGHRWSWPVDEKGNIQWKDAPK